EDQGPTEGRRTTPGLPADARRSSNPIAVKSNPDLARGRNQRLDRGFVPSLQFRPCPIASISTPGKGLRLGRGLPNPRSPPYTLGVMTRPLPSRRRLMAGAVGLTVASASALAGLAGCSRTPAPTD